MTVSNTIIKTLEKWPRSLMLCCCFLMVALITLLDYRSGWSYNFAPFYFVPIIIAGWYTNPAGAQTMAFTCAISWFVMDRAIGAPPDSLWIDSWNAAARLAVDSIVAALVCKMRSMWQREWHDARHDALTGCLNRRAYLEFAAELLADRRLQSMVVVFLDVDGFKQVNDSQGHESGDELLTQIGHTLRGTLRQSDIVARLGGDEFALAFPASDLPAAERVITELRHNLARMVAPRWAVGFSVGAVWCRTPSSLPAVLAEADRLMYAVKQAGKNNAQIVEFSP